MNLAPTAEQGILEDPYFPPLKQTIIERTGLDYYHGRNEVLAWQIYQRLRATRRSSCAQYLQLIKDSEQEFATLTNRLTVGETFFFRYPEQFDLLREKVVPSCLEENRHAKRLRIWSAGCSTGAEPYSLSILL